MLRRGAPVRRRGAWVAVAFALTVGACRQAAPAPRGEPTVDARPRPRPVELAHLTLKVLGMT